MARHKLSILEARRRTARLTSELQTSRSQHLPPWPMAAMTTANTPGVALTATKNNALGGPKVTYIIELDYDVP